MLACRIHAKEDLRIEPADMREVGVGEVLLKLGAAGICGSDLHYFFERRNGSFVVRASRKVDARPLLSGQYPLASALEAFHAAADKNRSTKIQIVA